MTSCPFLLSGELKLPPDLQSEAASLHEFLLNAEARLAPALLQGATSAQGSTDDAAELENLLLGQLDRGATNKRRIIRWLRITHAAITHLNRRGATIIPTRLAIDLQPARSPFQPDTTRDAARAARWRDGLFTWIRNNLEGSQPPAAEHLAAITLSAALCGGLLERRNLSALVKRAAGTIPIAGKLSYYDFETLHLGVRVEMLTRWHTDPVTEMLIARLSPQTDCALPEKLLIRAMQSLAGCTTQGVGPRSMADLVRGAAAFWLQRASRIDVEVALGRRLTHSLLLPAWLRLHDALPLSGTGSNPNRAHAVRVKNLDIAVPEESGHADPSEDMRLLVPWLDDCLALAAHRPGEDAGTVRRRIEAWAIPADAAAWAAPYRSWLISMLSGLNAAKRRLQPSTACAYFRTAMPALIAQIGTENPASLARGEIEAWYGDILEPMQPGRQRNLMAGGLREFHAHLVACYGVEPTSTGATFGTEGEFQRVDARIVSPDDITAARKWLEEQALLGRLPQKMRAVSLLLMLTFRCGLRRMEGFKLRLCDLHLANGGDLRIVPHAFRSLKSHASKRSIPLRAFLSKAEYDELAAWGHNRRAEEQSLGADAGAQYLFSIPRLARHQRGALRNTRESGTPPQEGLTVEECASLMHEAMRTVTGDDNLHIHHLRHSFASWTYLRLRGASFPGLATHFSHLPETSRWLKESRHLVSILIPGGNPGARSAAYATARLLGHSGPEMTFEHYVHVSDLIWLGLAQRNADSIPKPVRIVASGCKRSLAYTKDTAAGLVELVRENFVDRYVHHPHTRPKARRGTVLPAVPPARQEEYPCRLRQITAMLHAHDCGEPVAAIATALATPPALIEKALDLARTYAAGIRWPSREFREDVRLCPPTWKGPDERLFAETLIERLGSLDCRDQALLLDGVELHLRHFNPERKDVVFRTMSDAGEAKRYLEFIRELLPNAGQLQAVLRDVDPAVAQSGNWSAHTSYALWNEALKLPTGHYVVATNSPNRRKPAYRNWIGFRLVPHEGRPNHYLVAGLFLLALIAARSGVTACEY